VGARSGPGWCAKSTRSVRLGTARRHVVHVELDRGHTSFVARSSCIPWSGGRRDAGIPVAGGVLIVTVAAGFVFSRFTTGP